MADWLPGTREGQLNMAKIWAIIIQSKANAWDIPASILPELQIVFTDAENILQLTLSSDRSAMINTECQRFFGTLVEKTRFIKDRYFKTPPLVDEDYTTLLLKVPDTTRSSRGTPNRKWYQGRNRIWPVVAHVSCNRSMTKRQRHRWRGQLLRNRPRQFFVVINYLLEGIDPTPLAVYGAGRLGKH
ncbi:MAG: hypothetical protein LBH85_08265, partial [Treponema sp.]|nr:hypothetical protein [Treponema sp.]